MSPEMEIVARLMLAFMGGAVAFMAAIAVMVLKISVRLRVMDHSLLGKDGQGGIVAEIHEIRGAQEQIARRVHNLERRVYGLTD